MKKLLLLIFGCMLVTGCSSSATDTPEAYDQHITTLVTHADMDYESYNQSTQKNDINDTPLLRNQLSGTILSIDKIIHELEDTDMYDNDSSYRDGAIAFVKKIYDLLTDQEQSLLALYTEVNSYPDNKRTPDIERSYKQKQQTIIDQINITISENNAFFQQAQKDFAKKYNLILR